MPRLTVADANAALLDIAVQGETTLLPQLNMVQERLFTLGRWQGMEAVVEYGTQAGSLLCLGAVSRFLPLRFLRLLRQCLGGCMSIT